MPTASAGYSAATGLESLPAEGGAFFQAIIASVQQGIVVYDREGRIRLWNPYMEDLTGYPESQVLGCFPQHFFPFLEKAGVLEGRDRALAGEILSYPPFAWTIPRFGRAGWAIASHAPLRGSDGAILGVVETVTDITEARRAEERLRDDNRTLHESFENALVGFYRTTPGGRVLMTNPALRRILGVSSLEEIQVLDLEQQYCVLDYTRAEYRARLEREGRIEGLEACWRLQDGTIAFVRENARAVRDAAGAVLYYEGTIEDVTERKLAEEEIRRLNLELERLVELRTQDLRLRSVAIDAAANTIAVTDAQGCLEWVNPAFQELTSYAPGEVLGRHVSLLRSGMHPPAFYTEMWDTVQAGGVWRGDVINRRRDGSLCTVAQTITPVRGADGGIEHFIFIKDDVTEQRRMEEMRLRLNAALDQAQEATAILAPDLQLIYANAAFRELFGAGWREWPELAQVLAQVLGGQAWGGRLGYRAAGAELLIEGTVSPVLDGQQRVDSLTLVLRDVTREAERETHLRHTEKMNALGNLAGGVAHDFNNILSAIFASVELIEWRLEPDSPIRQNLEIIYQVAIRARDLNEQILRFSRSSDEKRIPFDLSSLALEACHLLRVTLADGVLLHTHLAPQIHVLGDPSQLHQVLVNLAINAGHAMRPRGGSLTIQLQRVELAGTQAQQLLPGPHALLTVKDTGCGMSAATVTRIFEPFFTTKAIGDGTGLGLSVVHGIIHSHGGVIKVASQPGQGSTFQVFLPIFQDWEDKPDPANAPDLTGCERILFVDDVDIVTALAKQGLQGFGYEVTAKTSALDALEVFQADPLAFDLLVTAQTMPRMSGAELTRRLRSLRPDLPVVLVSGASPGFELSRDLAMNYDAAIAKPFTTRDLATTVRQVLELREAGGQTGWPALGEEPGDGPNRTDRRPTILLVEDSRSTRRILVQMLAKAGFRVKPAGDGQEAWELFHAAAEQWPFAMVLTDLVMPRMDGLELIRKIRRIDPEIPIVVLSTLNDGETAKAALQLQVSEFLTKPVESRILAGCVTRHLEKWSHREQAEHLVETARNVRTARMAMEAVPVGGLPVFSICEQLSDAGGDVFRCLRRPDGSLFIILADVAGHSVLSSYAVASFLGMLTTSLETEPDLEKLFTTLNRNIQSGPFPEIPIATLAAHWDPRTGRLQVLNAGIPHGIWHREALGRTEAIPLNGAPLGLFDQPRMNGKVLALEPGDRVLFGSDGLLDVFSQDRIPFRDLALDLWRGYSGLPIGEALQAMCELARGHCGIFQDDLLVVGFEQPEWLPAAQELLRVFPSTLEGVEACCQDAQAFLDDRVPGLGAGRRFDLLLALREALSNAQRHGNREDPAKRIGLHFNLAEDPARIRVVDEGRGFQMDARVAMPAVDLEGGRGLPLLGAFTLGPRLRDGELEFGFQIGGNEHG